MYDGKLGIFNRADERDGRFAGLKSRNGFGAGDDARHYGQRGIKFQRFFQVDLIGEDRRAQQRNAEHDRAGAVSQVALVHGGFKRGLQQHDEQRV